MNLSDQLLHKANLAYQDGLHGLAGYFTELALRSVGRPATGLEMPKNSPPDTPLRPTHLVRQARKDSCNPWAA